MIEILIEIWHDLADLFLLSFCQLNVTEVFAFARETLPPLGKSQGTDLWQIERSNQLAYGLRSICFATW
jgi:hypothetical protein